MQAIASGLLKNKTLKLLNLESNYISGTGIIELLEGINANQVVTEFRVVNQVRLQDFMQDMFDIIHFGKVPWIFPIDVFSYKNFSWVIGVVSGYHLATEGMCLSS